MKVGDLVRVSSCPDPGYDNFACECFFCSGKSNRIGVVLGLEPRNSWYVMFDCGSWLIHAEEEANGKVEVLNKSR